MKNKETLKVELFNEVLPLYDEMAVDEGGGCVEIWSWVEKNFIPKSESRPLDAPVILQGELLPCPFCGGIAETYKPVKGHGMYVGCNDCHASMFGIDDKNLDNSERVAIDSWNKRAGREPKSK